MKNSSADIDRSSSGATSTVTDSANDKKQVRNTYKWLLRKEEAKANAKGPDAEELKAQAIVN